MDQDSRSLRILVVDDVPANVRLLKGLLEGAGYAVESAGDGRAALEMVARSAPDLVLLDVQMPEVGGIEVLKRLRAAPEFRALPIVMVTALEERAHRIEALEAGADDFVNKPVDPQELLARVRSLLRIKTLFDTVSQQSNELAAWSRELEARVSAQVEQLGRLSRLKRFFSSRLAESLLATDEGLLESHRREIVVVFLDLRGYTAFAETSEPEEVMRALGEFHAAMGQRIETHEGTLERFTGDGMMIFFNDPVPVPDAARRALAMAIEMQRDAAELCERWRLRGFELGLGIGIAQGFATLGRIGYEGRIDYGAIGAVTNLAQRLCALAASGEILAARRVLAGLEPDFRSVSRGATVLAGFRTPVDVLCVEGTHRPAVASTTDSP